MRDRLKRGSAALWRGMTPNEAAHRCVSRAALINVYDACPETSICLQTDGGGRNTEIRL